VGKDTPSLKLDRPRSPTSSNQLKSPRNSYVGKETPSLKLDRTRSPRTSRNQLSPTPSPRPSRNSRNCSSEQRSRSKQMEDRTKNRSKSPAPGERNDDCIPKSKEVRSVTLQVNDSEGKGASDTVNNSPTTQESNKKSSYSLKKKATISHLEIDDVEVHGGSIGKSPVTEREHRLSQKNTRGSAELKTSTGILRKSRKSEITVHHSEYSELEEKKPTDLRVTMAASDEPSSRPGSSEKKTTLSQKLKRQSSRLAPKSIDQNKKITALRNSAITDLEEKKTDTKRETRRLSFVDRMENMKLKLKKQTTAPVEIPHMEEESDMQGSKIQSETIKRYQSTTHTRQSRGSMSETPYSAAELLRKSRFHTGAQVPKKVIRATTLSKQEIEKSRTTMKGDEINLECSDIVEESPLELPSPKYLRTSIRNSISNKTDNQECNEPLILSPRSSQGLSRKGSYLTINSRTRSQSVCIRKEDNGWNEEQDKSRKLSISKSSTPTGKRGSAPAELRTSSGVHDILKKHIPTFAHKESDVSVSVSSNSSSDSERSEILHGSGELQIGELFHFDTRTQIDLEKQRAKKPPLYRYTICRKRKRKKEKVKNQSLHTKIQQLMGLDFLENQLLHTGTESSKRKEHEFNLFKNMVKTFQEHQEQNFIQNDTAEDDVVRIGQPHDENNNGALQALCLYVKSMDTFKDLIDPESLPSLVKVLTIRKVKAGDWVFQKGDSPGDKITGGLYAILWGSVGVYINQTDNKPVAVLPTGTKFGDQALINDSTRNASIKAVEDSIFGVIQKEEYVRFRRRSQLDMSRGVATFLQTVLQFSSIKDGPWSYLKLCVLASQCKLMRTKKAMEVINPTMCGLLCGVIRYGDFSVIQAVKIIKRFSIPQSRDHKNINLMKYEVHIKVATLTSKDIFGDKEILNKKQKKSESDFGQNDIVPLSLVSVDEGEILLIDADNFRRCVSKWGYTHIPCYDMKSDTEILQKHLLTKEWDSFRKGLSGNIANDNPEDSRFLELTTVLEQYPRKNYKKPPNVSNLRSIEEMQYKAPPLKPIPEPTIYTARTELHKKLIDTKQSIWTVDKEELNLMKGPGYHSEDRVKEPHLIGKGDVQIKDSAGTVRKELQNEIKKEEQEILQAGQKIKVSLPRPDLLEPLNKPRRRGFKYGISKLSHDDRIQFDLLKKVAAQ